MLEYAIMHGIISIYKSMSSIRSLAQTVDMPHALAGMDANPHITHERQTSVCVTITMYAMISQSLTRTIHICVCMCVCTYGRVSFLGTCSLNFSCTQKTWCVFGRYLAGRLGLRPFTEFMALTYKLHTHTHSNAQSIAVSEMCASAATSQGVFFQLVPCSALLFNGSLMPRYFRWPAFAQCRRHCAACRDAAARHRRVSVLFFCRVSFARVMCLWSS